MSTSYARARTHTCPLAYASVRTLAARESRQNIPGGDCPCRLCPVRNVWRCAPFLTVLGTHCISQSFPSHPQARRPRAAQGKGGAVKDVTSESEDDGVEGVEWGVGMYGVRMTPAHPWYVGRGDDKCGGEVVYSIQDIRQLLSVQPEDTKRWLTTSQMGWALTREEMNWSMRKTSAKVNQWRDS